MASTVGRKKAERLMAYPRLQSADHSIRHLMPGHSSLLFEPSRKKASLAPKTEVSLLISMNHIHLLSTSLSHDHQRENSSSFRETSLQIFEDVIGTL
jgi:hypothetical protein